MGGCLSFSLIEIKWSENPWENLKYSKHIPDSMGSVFRDCWFNIKSTKPTSFYTSHCKPTLGCQRFPDTTCALIMGPDDVDVHSVWIFSENDSQGLWAFSAPQCTMHIGQKVEEEERPKWSPCFTSFLSVVWHHPSGSPTVSNNDCYHRRWLCWWKLGCNNNNPI